MADSSGLSRELLCRRVGVWYGRIWHIDSGTNRKGRTNMLLPQTLCGKDADRTWRPSWRNPDPKVCDRCLSAVAKEAAVGPLGPDGTAAS